MSVETTAPARSSGHWTVLIPVKSLETAKSRLDVPPSDRVELTIAMAVSTVRAARRCHCVSSVLGITTDARVAHALRAVGANVADREPDGGLNMALRYGAELAALLEPGTRIAALTADLPALDPGELSTVLTAAARHDLSFVADAVGTGTTLLAASSSACFRPAFGGRSRQAHVAAGAFDLTHLAGPSLRRDVDTTDDLRRVLVLPSRTDRPPLCTDRPRPREKP